MSARVVRDHRPRPYSRLETDAEVRERIRAAGRLAYEWQNSIQLDAALENAQLPARRIVWVAP